jgi:hypothetical protein
MKNQAATGLAGPSFRTKLQTDPWLLAVHASMLRSREWLDAEAIIRHHGMPPGQNRRHTYRLLSEARHVGFFRFREVSAEGKTGVLEVPEYRAIPCDPVVGRRDGREAFDARIPCVASVFDLARAMGVGHDASA